MMTGYLQSSFAGGGAGVPRDMSADPLDRAALATPVLIVEDEAMIAWMIESLLEDIGFSTIAIAASGEEALEASRESAPGLIVTDINLGPGMDGVVAAAAIRATTLAPVIFITGYANDDALARVRKDVPDAAVLRKPVQPVAFRAAIARALRRQAPQ